MNTINKFQREMAEKIIREFFAKREKAGGKRTYTHGALWYELEQFLRKEGLIQ